jgi:hypothetical protein
MSARGALAPAAPRERRASRWWLDVLAIAWLLWLYDAISNLAPLRLHQALANAAGVFRLEQVLHLDPELTLDRWLASHHTLGLALSDYYDNAHFVVTLGVLGWLWWRRAELYRPLRNALLLTNVIAFAVFWRYPVAPPRMLGGFVDVVSSTHAFGDWHDGPLASHANQLAAMPSLHMAWAAWCGLAIWRVSRRAWVRAAGLLHPFLTALTVLATGNHFLLDLVAGLAALAIATCALSLPRRAGAWMAVLRRVFVRALRGLGDARERLGNGHLRPRTACHKVVTKSATR